MLLDEIRELLPRTDGAPCEREPWPLRGMHSATVVTKPSPSQAGDFDLIIYFQHLDKPGCLFGFRWPNVQSYVAEDQPDEGMSESEMLSTFSSLVLANLEEAIEADGGVRAMHCDGKEVVWV